MPNFRQCRVCGRWVCPQVCWNEARGLCKDCAPDLGEQTPSIQAKVAVEQAWQQARSVDQTASAGATTRPAFCAQCGGSLGADDRFCSHCGHRVGAAPKQ